jgi:hypothetical protein
MRGEWGRGRRGRRGYGEARRNEGKGEVVEELKIMSFH